MQIAIFYLNNYEVIHRQKPACFSRFCSRFFLLNPPKPWCTEQHWVTGTKYQQRNIVRNIRNILAAIFTPVLMFFYLFCVMKNAQPANLRATIHIMFYICTYFINYILYVYLMLNTFAKIISIFLSKCLLIGSLSFSLSLLSTDIYSAK